MLYSRCCALAFNHLSILYKLVYMQCNILFYREYLIPYDLTRQELVGYLNIFV